MTSDTLANIRVAVFGLTGAVCLLYAVMALAQGRPDPMPFWIPSAFGLAAAVVLTLTSMLAGDKQADMAWDEGYANDARVAASAAFWVNMAMNPLFGLLLAWDVMEYPTTFAIMGLVTAATFLLLIVWFELRGRGRG
jgi:hypothetical protein